MVYSKNLTFDDVKRRLIALISIICILIPEIFNLLI